MKTLLKLHTAPVMDEDRQQVRIIREQIFVWQSIFALRKIREISSPREIGNRINIYVALTELATNKHTEQFSTYLSSLEELIFINRETISDHLKVLETNGLIRISKIRHDSKGKFMPIEITLLNGDFYPVGVSEEVIPESSESEIPVTPHIKKLVLEPSLRSLSQEKKKREKFEVEKEIEKIDDQDLKNSLLEWSQHKLELKEPLTKLAYQKLLKRLVSWGTKRAVEAIDFSIEHHWKGVYEKENKILGSNSPPPKPSTTKDVRSTYEWIERNKKKGAGGINGSMKQQILEKLQKLE